MLSWKKPTPEEVDRAVALLGGYEQHYRYFFDKLANPEWIAPLLSKGFFSNPPHVRLDDNQRIVATPPWPASHYLARMAPLAPELVLHVILKIPPTKNTWVQEDLLDAALGMPANLAVQLVPKIKEWIETPRLALRSDKIGALISLLARGGEIPAALDLARTALAVIPGEEITIGLPGKETHQTRRDPQARFDNWYYGEILKKYIPDLVKAVGIEAFELLCDLLHTALQVRRTEGEQQNPQDYSHIWHRAIEDHSQNQTFGISGLLISAVRDAAESIERSDPAKIPQLVSILESRKWNVFQRIALHLLRLRPDVAFPLVAERLTNRQLFDDRVFRHEYFLLLHSQYTTLIPEQQRQILTWIEKGPDTKIIRENRKEFTGEEPSEEDIKKYVEYWQLEHLVPLKDVLPEDWKTRYKNLVGKLGEPEHAEFASYNTSWVGPTSPKTSDDLRAMSVEEVISFLKSWKPSEDHWSPSPEGLGRVIMTVIEADPQKFALESYRFQDTHPTYVRSLISGLRNALGQNRTFSWSQVFAFCQWVVRQSWQGQPETSKGLDRDPHWGWARKSIAELLQAGFGGGAAEIPFDARTQVWDILEPITHDPEPDEKYEAEAGADIDPSHISINTTRGEAMHAVVRYALWVRRHIEGDEGAQERLTRGFDEMPEVREVLDAHLQEDFSLGIRSIYGRYFPWLLLIDRDWASAHVAKIFPLQPEQGRFFSAAWESYILFCPAFDNVFDALEPVYRHVVNELRDDTETRRHDEDHQLAQHLMTFYWRGKINFNETERLLVEFWQKANIQARTHAIEFIGRSLANTKDEIPAEISARLKLLWGHRLSFAVGSRNLKEYQDELAAFGWWFIAEKLESDWEIAQLKEVLLVGKKIDPDSMVVERLASLASTLPRETVECLRIMVEEAETWGIYVWRDEAKKLLANALEKPEARSEAIRLIHKIGAMGHLEFGELLPS